MNDTQTIASVKSRIWITAYLRALELEVPKEAEATANDAVRRFRNWRLGPHPVKPHRSEATTGDS